MSALAGALCVGKWWLFDSVELEDHLEARAICAQCPAITACHRLMRLETASYPWGGSGPIGTWAGQLLGTTRRREWRAKGGEGPAHTGVIRGKIGAISRAPSRVFGDPLAEGSNRPKEEAG